MNSTYNDKPLNMDGTSAPIRPPMRGLVAPTGKTELPISDINNWYPQAFRLSHDLPLSGELVTMTATAHANMLSRAQEHDRLCGELVKVSALINQLYWFEAANSTWPFASDQILSCQDVAVKIIIRYMEGLKTPPAPARLGLFTRLVLALKAFTQGQTPKTGGA